MYRLEWSSSSWNCLLEEGKSHSSCLECGLLQRVFELLRWVNKEELDVPTLTYIENWDNAEEIAPSFHIYVCSWHYHYHHHHSKVSGHTLHRTPHLPMAQHIFFLIKNCMHVWWRAKGTPWLGDNHSPWSNDVQASRDDTYQTRRGMFEARNFGARKGAHAGWGKYC